MEQNNNIIGIGIGIGAANVRHNEDNMERNINPDILTKTLLNDTFTRRKDIYSYCVKIIRYITELYPDARYYMGVTSENKLNDILDKSHIVNFTNRCICIITETNNIKQSDELEHELEYRFRHEKYQKNITSHNGRPHDMVYNCKCRTVYVVFELSKEEIESNTDYIFDKLLTNKERVIKEEIERKNILKKQAERKKNIMREKHIQILTEQYKKRDLFVLNLKKQTSINMENKRIKNIQKMISPYIQTIKENNIKANNNTCQCCLCHYDRDELIYCDKLYENHSHVTCKYCVLRNIDVMISNGVCNFKCIYGSSDNCGGVYEDRIIKNILYDDVVKYDKFMEIYEITNTSNMALMVDNFQVCPHCRRFGLEIDNMIPISKIRCERCFEYWCNKCGRDAHDLENGSTCFTIPLNIVIDKHGEKIIENNERELYGIIDNMISDIISRSIIDLCSHCNSSYMKTDGCNLITCTKCGNLTCYCCGEKIIPFMVEDGRMVSKYHHFKGNNYNNGSGTCPLYYNDADINSNQENKIYKIRKITDGLIQLMDSNKELAYNIYDRINTLIKSNTLDYDINIELLQNRIIN